jgi:hypothetical protein
MKPIGQFRRGRQPILHSRRHAEPFLHGDRAPERNERRLQTSEHFVEPDEALAPTTGIVDPFCLIIPGIS